MTTTIINQTSPENLSQSSVHWRGTRDSNIDVLKMNGQFQTMNGQFQTSWGVDLIIVSIRCEQRQSCFLVSIRQKFVFQNLCDVYATLTKMLWMITFHNNSDQKSNCRKSMRSGRDRRDISLRYDHDLWDMIVNLANNIFNWNLITSRWTNATYFKNCNHS